MSERKLRNYLLRLQRDLEGSADYRSKVSDKKIHNFFLTRGTLISQTYLQLREDLVPYDAKEVQVSASLLFRKLKGAINSKIGKKGQQVKAEAGPLNNRVNVIDVTFVGSGKSSVFGVIQTIKQENQEEFNTYIKTLYAKAKSEVDRFKKGSSFFDITHDDSSVVASQRVKQIGTKFQKYAKNKPDIQKLISTYSLKLAVYKDDDAKEVVVSIGATTDNIRAGQKVDKPILTAAKKQLKIAIKKLGGIPGLEGSDSFETQYRKTFLRDSLGRFAKVAGVTIKSENLKIKKSKRAPTSINLRPNIEDTGSSTNEFPTKSIRKFESRINLQALVPVLNQRLQAAIVANMGTPALNYRTGRFANSARVTDIATTAKGHPSIGFTYMKDPYQIFEHPGGSPTLATPDRDPRKIISESIRDVARGLIDQRFFTRRV